jgi:SAM-dependent methyltransferase
MAETAVSAWEHPATYWNHHTVRELERDSIREFMTRNRHLLCGRVLDFGAGKPGTCREPQPYRHLVEGEYVPYDKGDAWPRGPFDAVMCNQVFQYLEDPVSWAHALLMALKPGGHLVMTYATNWEECEASDLARFTRIGMDRLLKSVNFEILGHERRASINLGGFQFALGYGVVARRRCTTVRAYRLMANRSHDEAKWDMQLAAGGYTRPRIDESAAVLAARSDWPMYTRLGIDESAAFLTAKLKWQAPFLFLRYGDGAIECINGLGKGQTCDGEKYSPDLARGMRQAWDDVVHSTFGSYVGLGFVMDMSAYNAGQDPNCIGDWRFSGAFGGPQIYIGDWLSASFGANRSTEYRAEYDRLIGDANLNFLHFEALLLTRESRELLDFYKAVKADTRRKVYLGPAAHAPAAKMLGCEHVVTPMRDLLACADSIYDKLAGNPFDVLLWAAGMAGTIPVVKLWEAFPGRTYINLGSAMDPLTRSATEPRGYTRSGQLTHAQAKAFFHELL